MVLLSFVLGTNSIFFLTLRGLVPFFFFGGTATDDDLEAESKLLDAAFLPAGDQKNVERVTILLLPLLSPLM